jgi:hypothetical protein
VPSNVASAAKQMVGSTANMEPKGSPSDIVLSTTGRADQATAATLPNTHDATASREWGGFEFRPAPPSLAEPRRCVSEP